MVHVSSLSLTRGGGHDHTQQPWPCASSLGKEGQIGVKFRPFSSSEKEEKVNMAKVNMATLQEEGVVITMPHASGVPLYEGDGVVRSWPPHFPFHLGQR